MEKNTSFSKKEIKMAKQKENISLRKATEADTSELYRIHTSAIRETCSSHYNEQQVTAWVGRQNPGRYLIFVRRGEIIVAQDKDGQIVGFGHSMPDSMLTLEEKDGLQAVQIKGLFIDPKYITKGIGSRIIEYLEERAVEEGAEMLTVISSMNAINFYTKCGFVPLSEFTELKLTDDIFLQCKKMAKKLQTQ